MRLTAAAALLFLLGCAPREEQRPLRVAVLGDRTGGHTPGVFPAIVAEVDSLNPDVVLAVGDLIEGYTKDVGALREQWAEVLPMLQRIRVPLLLCPGNHDVFSAASEAIYRELMGPLYHSRTIADVHFYMLDVSRAVLPELIDAQQWDWFEGELRRISPSATKVVVLHRPLWFHTLAAGLADTLHELFVREGVDLVIAGHKHKYFYAEYDGVRYVSVGPSGGSFFFWSPGENQFHQFLWILIRDGSFDIKVMKSGEALPADITTLREAKLGHAVHDRGLIVSDVRCGPGGARDTVLAEVRSLGGSRPEGTLRWDVPEGWAVSPCSLRFAVSPRETLRCAFAVTGHRPWPAPLLRTTYPYGRHQVADLRLPARVVRELPCIALSQDITVDGSFDPTWELLHAEDLLYVSSRREAPAGVASFRFGHRSGSIYVWARCGAWEGRPPTEHPEGWMKSDDAVFVALQTITEGPVYTILMNGAGQCAAFARGDPDWQSECTSAVKRRTDSWDAELAIRLACMAGAQPRGTWKVNFGRRHPIREGDRFRVTTAQWMIPSVSDSSCLGRLVFEN